MVLVKFELGVTHSTSAEGAAEGSQWRARFGAATGSGVRRQRYEVITQTKRRKENSLFSLRLDSTNGPETISLASNEKSCPVSPRQI